MSTAKTWLTMAVCATAVSASTLPASAQVQIWIPRHRHHYIRYFEARAPGVRIMRIPAGGYHYGGINVYRLRGSRWEFGYPQNYKWPYGYAPGYHWPYGYP